MRMSAKYWQDKADKALRLARDVEFLEGQGSALALELRERAVKWEQRAMAERSMPNGYQGPLS